MLTPVQAAVAYAEMFRRDVLAPAMIAQAEPLRAQIHQSIEPIAYADAKRATFRPVRIGHEWGPAWSTAWFRLSGKVPASMAGKAVALRFSTDTEALLWLNGVPAQGLDVNRDTAPLFARGGGQTVETFVEAACNHPFGAEGLQWDPADVHRRWKSPTPGRFLAADLVVIDAAATLLYWRFTFATQLLRELPPDSPRAGALIALLRHACAAVNDQSVSASASAMSDLIGRELANGAGGSATLGYAAGHAHIDTAWLWPLRETRRKCLRTFSSVLGLMNGNPEFVFMCSQAQQYAFVEEDSPTLFRQITSRVKEGRWEPTGGMWIEPDCNCVSGESLVRQVLHGSRYWESRFGTQGRQRMLYLPDTFGFPACLPQVMRLSGLDTFITNKMIWNDTTLPPHTNFVWRGLGGAEVLAHFTPGHDYNNTNTPKELRHAESKHEGKALRIPGARQGSPGSVARFFHPFGFGDGGGGPTAWQIENLRLSRDNEGLPRMRMATSGHFCDDLARDYSICRGTAAAWPVWDGELYLELHRGTYTTQAQVKAANLAAEQALRVAELMVVAGGAASAQDRAALDEAWKLTLLNQFHDILPGSSINWVYKDTREQHARVQALAAEVMARAAAQVRSPAPPAPAGKPRSAATKTAVIMVNPATTSVTRVLDIDGEPALGPVLPGASVSVVDLAKREPVPARTAVKAVWTRDTCELSSGPLHAVIGRDGRIISLSSDSFEMAAPAGMNELALYRDRPKMWDAWDVDEAHSDAHEPDAVRVTSLAPIDNGDLRKGVRVKGTLGQSSRFEQDITLDAAPANAFEHALRIVTRIDWRESHRILRARFPSSLRPAQAHYGTQFGVIERPTRRSTPAERAAFEVPASGWMGLASPEGFLQLVVPGKYGFSCHDGVMGVSLLRSPTYPDPQADRGMHTLTMHLAVHPRPAWSDDGPMPVEPLDAAVMLAETLLNPPVLIQPGPSVGSRKRTVKASGNSISIVHAHRGGHRSTALPIISAIKPAEDSDSVVVRLYEAVGGRGPIELVWRDPVSSVRVIDLLERTPGRSVPRPDLSHDRSARRTTLDLDPGQIVTLLARRG